MREAIKVGSTAALFCRYTLAGVGGPWGGLSPVSGSLEGGGSNCHVGGARCGRGRVCSAGCPVCRTACPHNDGRQSRELNSRYSHSYPHLLRRE